MDFGGQVEYIIQGIATGAGNHNHSAVTIQLKQSPINARIFPTSIVDQMVAVNALEHLVVSALD
jgi:hypothetical protein